MQVLHLLFQQHMLLVHQRIVWHIPCNLVIKLIFHKLVQRLIIEVPQAHILWFEPQQLTCFVFQF